MFNASMDLHHYIAGTKLCTIYYSVQCAVFFTTKKLCISVLVQSLMFHLHQITLKYLLRHMK